MSLTLYTHPLSSYVHKVLIPLYENAIPFTPHPVFLGDPKAAAEYKAIWPMGKLPSLRDEARDRLIPESTAIIEYLDRYYPGRVRFIPEDPELARQTRFRDRFYDLLVHTPVQKIITDRIRPAGQNDPYGVEEARRQLYTALDIVDREMASQTWAVGDTITMADCAAAPPLFYTNNNIMLLADTHKNLDRYLKRLMELPSYARALEEAKPYFHLLPKA